MNLIVALFTLTLCSSLSFSMPLDDTQLTREELLRWFLEEGSRLDDSQSTEEDQSSNNDEDNVSLDSDSKDDDTSSDASTDGNGGAQPLSRKKRNAKVCKWLGDRTGWYCDDAASRSVWRGIQRVFRGVTDCNSLCKSNGRRGGRCTSTRNYDRSSWCPRGQTCTCY